MKNINSLEHNINLKIDKRKKIWKIKEKKLKKKIKKFLKDDTYTPVSMKKENNHLALYDPHLKSVKKEDKYEKRRTYIQIYYFRFITPKQDKCRPSPRKGATFT